MFFRELFFQKLLKEIADAEVDMERRMIEFDKERAEVSEEIRKGKERMEKKSRNRHLIQNK